LVFPTVKVVVPDGTHSRDDRAYDPDGLGEWTTRHGRVATLHSKLLEQRGFMYTP
jgi:hypothetical protein